MQRRKQPKKGGSIVRQSCLLPRWEDTHWMSSATGRLPSGWSTLKRYQTLAGQSYAVGKRKAVHNLKSTSYYRPAERCLPCFIIGCLQVPE